MTVIMDKFFIKIGLDGREIKSSSIRGPLYVGMLCMVGMTLVFLGLTLFG